MSAANAGKVSYKGWSGIKRAFATPSAFTLLLLGFGSGLPFLLIASMTLSTRLRDVGLDLGSIGLISLASFFYLLKFVWAPLIDRYAFPLTAFLGRRRLGLSCRGDVVRYLLHPECAHRGPDAAAAGLAVASDPAP